MKSLSSESLRWIVTRALAFGTVLTLRADIVINEVHYDPDLKTEPVEFVELLNTGPASVSLAGWSLTRAVEYTFSAGVSIPAGGYVVVAENPAALATKFGGTAYGPWVGTLANEGETIELLDAAGRKVDSVDYQLGFPWPTVGEPPGYSIELIHPGLDNSVGGNWRVSVAGNPSQQTTELFPTNSMWSYFKGLSEASSPTTAWRDPAFDASGWSGGLGPVGYDRDYPFPTQFDDMSGSYRCFFLRKTFVVEDPQAFGALTLDAMYDDGFKVWINGVSVLDVALPTGEVPYDVDAIIGPARESMSYDSFAIANPQAYLRTGMNVIAVQVHNVSLTNSSDCFFDARLTGMIGPSTRGPTPGARNSVYATQAPPVIRQVDHSPTQPAPGQAVTVTARVTDPDGMGPVTLQYQRVAPGSYVELTDPQYETGWTAVTMRDDGQGGDVMAGDGVYTCVLPGNLQIYRCLVRYRVEAADAGGRSIRVPYADDPVPNFAYFVYGEVPTWTGAVWPGTAGALGQTFTVGAVEMNRLPVIHLIGRKSTVEQATWFSRYGGDSYLWMGTLVYDGKVYDHVHYRARGGVWRYSMVKNMWKFDLNRGHDWQMRDNWGNKFKTKWSKLNLGANIQQGDYEHRGEQGLFESVGFRLFQLADVASPHSSFVQFRIVDAANETTSGDQYEGDFWGVYLALEQENGRFLDEHGLPDSNFYKMEGGTGELNNLGPDGPTDKSDLNYILQNYGNASDAWWRANWNLPRFYSYQAIVQAIHHYDISNGKNYFYYHHPVTGLWEVVPWDLDLTWAHNMYRSDSGGAGVDAIAQNLFTPDRIAGTGLQSGTGVMRLNGSRPAMELEFRNRLREIRDLLWNADEAGRLIDEYAGRLRGPTATPSLIDADRAQWDYNPKMEDGNYTPHLGKARQGRFYQFPRETATNGVTRDFNGTVQLLKNYVAIRSSYLDELATDPLIPQRPTVSYEGPAGFPANRLAFRSSAFSGVGGYRSIQWRVGEVTVPTGPSWQYLDPWLYEIEPVWESGEITTPTRDLSLPPGLLKPGHAYRVRAKMTDQTGRTSHWSPAVEFVAGVPDNAAMLVDYLRMTEVMPAPVGGNELEYVELLNTSTDTVLNLEGAKFTDGIDYVFPAGATLAPGAYALVVRATNAAAFRAAYGLGSGVPIFGPYAGSLDNNGESLVLKTSPAGDPIVAFDYSDGRAWPLPAFGAGHSLVALDRSLSGQATGSLDYPGNWRVSSLAGGSPGQAEPAVPASGLVLNEIAAHTDYFDPQRPEYDSNDWIEVMNAGSSTVSMAGYYLSDDLLDLKKWALPATDLPPGSRVVFHEVTDFHNPITSGFGIDKAGEQLFLSYLPGTTADRVADFVGFKGQENERSLGRFADGVGEFRYPMLRTEGAANSAPLASVVISEVMYHPVDPTATNDNTWEEFVEIHNPTAAPVALEDTNGVWRLDGGISFTFAAGTVIPAGGTLLVVNIDPASPSVRADFEAAYGLPPGQVTLVGPYGGKLGNRSDRVGLEKPQAPDLLGEGYSWVVVDEVVYGNQDPWPASPNGTGDSLQRLAGAPSGMAPSSWQAAPPSPGTVGGPDPDQDTDGDGMPDSWEDSQGFNKGNPSDADEDADLDGLSNLQEYLAGTDPWQDTSALRIHHGGWVDEQVQLWVEVKAGRGYVVEYCEDLGQPEWLELEVLPTQVADGLVPVADTPPAGTESRSYRARLHPVP